MKVTGPGTGPGSTPVSPETTAAGDRAGPTSGTTGPEESGRVFADKLAAAAPAREPTAGAAVAAGAQAQGPHAAGTQPAHAIVSPEIAADLAAGRLTPRAAVDQMIEQILSRQLGADAPAAVRDKVRAALEEALENDPLLADKLRRLGG